MLKLYTDTHIAKAVTVQLRRREVDIIRCEDVGMAEADDRDHLRYATDHSRAVVTQDDDFARLHVNWQQSGEKHAGIFLLPNHLQGDVQISYAFRHLFAYSEMISGGAGTIKEDIENQLIYL